MTVEPTDHRARARKLLSASLALALAACTGGPAAAPTSSPSPTPPPPPIAPLTGLVASSEAVTERAVLAVKIDNHTAARPHVGLDKADLVYEEPVEGGLTRFMAIFQSRDASTVGPIRSARFADIEILADYGKPILAFSGAARVVVKALEASDLVLVPHGSNGSIYHRAGGRPAPHNLFSSTKALRRVGARRATAAESLFAFGTLPPPPGASASPSPSPSGSPSPAPAWRSGARARIPFSSGAFTAVWTYDAKSERYRRSHGSTPHRAANGTRITARNVLVVMVEPGSSTRKPISLAGSGRAVLLRDGVRVTGRWSREGSARTTFTDSEGRPFVFAPGNTWIELVPPHVRPRYR